MRGTQDAARCFPARAVTVDVADLVDAWDDKRHLCALRLATLAGQTAALHGKQ